MADFKNNKTKDTKKRFRKAGRTLLIKSIEEDFDFGSITYRTALKFVRHNDISSIRFGDMVEYVGLARSDDTLYPFNKRRRNNYNLKRVPTRCVYYIEGD
mgnify:CR=1 FL=1